MHADEAVQAYIFADLLEHGKYRYDPVHYHGPLPHFINLPLMRALGVQKLDALQPWQFRLQPVFAGLLLVVLAACCAQNRSRSSFSFSFSQKTKTGPPKPPAPPSSPAPLATLATPSAPARPSTLAPLSPPASPSALPSASTLSPAPAPSAFLPAALLAACSPLLVYFSRMAIHETLLACLALAVPLAVARFLDTRRVGWLLAAGVALGGLHATKETWSIIAFSWAVAALALAGPRRLWRLLRETGAARLALAAGVALAVSFLLHSNLGRHPRGFADAWLTLFQYRTGGGHDKPWSYYLTDILTFRFAGRGWHGEGALLLFAALSLFQICRMRICRMRNAERGMRNAGGGVPNTKLPVAELPNTELPNTERGIRNAELPIAKRGMRNAELKTHAPQAACDDAGSIPQSSILNPQSSFLIPHSAIPHSAFRIPQSVIPHSALPAFLALSSVVQIAVYSIIAYKTPWLMLVPVAGLVPLAGCGFAWLTRGGTDGDTGTGTGNSNGNPDTAAAAAAAAAPRRIPLAAASGDPVRAGIHAPALPAAACRALAVACRALAGGTCRTLAGAAAALALVVLGNAPQLRALVGARATDSALPVVYAPTLPGADAALRAAVATLKPGELAAVIGDDYWPLPWYFRARRDATGYYEATEAPGDLRPFALVIRCGYAPLAPPAPFVHLAHPALLAHPGDVLVELRPGYHARIAK
jgi:predicted membrane-bound mannosyltransferase